MSVPLPGETAPLFDAADQHGTRRRLTDYAGSWLLLYFYPKDGTPGCTTEACSFRDHLSTLQEKGVEVIGVSTDDADSHRSFAQKYGLNFPLLPDTDQSIGKSYGAFGEKSVYGKLVHGMHRMTFLIDPQGTIAKVYKNVQPDEHAAEILHDVQQRTD